MPRYSPPASGRLFRGNELHRLIMMIVMLGILAAMIGRARDPSTWEIFAKKVDVPRVTAPAARPGEPGARPFAAAPSPQANSKVQQPNASGAVLAVADNSKQAASEASDSAGPPTAAAPAPAEKKPEKTPIAPTSPPGNAAQPTIPPAGESLNPPDPSVVENPAPPLASTPGTTTDEAAKALLPTGPTDEDPEQWKEFVNEEVPGVSDGDLGTKDHEMLAYKRLLLWLSNQPDALLERRALKNLVYAQFIQDPDKYRGKLIHLDLELRRAVVYPDEKDKIGVDKLFEFWGVNDESRGKLYVVVTTDPPVNMPIAANIQEHVHFDGYFLKLQGYQPASAKPGAKALLAPMLIGRFTLVPRPPIEPSTLQNSLLWLVGGAMLAFAAVRLALMLAPKRPARTLRPLPEIEEDAVNIDTWLDLAQDGELPGRGGSLDSPREPYSDGSRGSVNGRAANGQPLNGHHAGERYANDERSDNERGRPDRFSDEAEG